HPAAAVPDGGLPQGDEVAAVLTVRALDGLARLFTRALELTAEAPHFLLHPHDQLHAGQIQSRAGEILDAPQTLDVAVAVAAAAAARAGRIEESPSLGDPQGLRMDTRQLGRDGDDAQTLLGAVDHLTPPSGFSATP